MEEKQQSLTERLTIKAKSVFTRNRSFKEVQAEMEEALPQPATKAVKPGPLNQGGRHPVEQG